MLADSPDEPQTLDLLAITLATAKKYQQAEITLRQLARLRPNDLAPHVRLAEVSLWKGDYPTAVERYQQLLGDALDRPALWQGFADAAAGCKGCLTKDQKDAAIKLARVFRDREDIGITTLTRLGYALSQVEAPPELTSSLLERAFQNVPRDDVAARKELAGVLSAAGMTDQALQMYEGLPLTVEEQGRVVDVYVAAKQYDEAEQLARKLCRSRPGDGKLRFHLADVLAWSRRYDKAVQVYQEMLKEKPDDSRVQEALARVHLWAKRYDKSLSMYRGMLLAHPELKTYNKGYIDAAASATRLDARVDGPIITRLVDWARRDCSEDPEILARLAWVCQRVGNRPAALALRQQAVARYQQLLGDTFDRPALWQGFADATAGCKGRLTEDQKQAAIKLATLLAERKDVAIPTLTRLGYALTQVEAPPELTSSLLERAFRNLRRNDLAARKELAGVLVTARMTDQALQLYEGLPLTVEEQSQLVDIYVAAGEFDEAEQLARKLCQSRPDDGELRFHLAEVLAWSRRYDKAVQVYQEMLEKKPDDSRVQTALARVHLWAKRYDKSLAVYRGMLLAQPELKTYYKGYIDAAASATRLDARVDGPIITRLVDWARRDCSEDVEILPRLAWVCRRVKNMPAALTLLQLACKAAPEDDVLTLQLADLFYDMGRYGEAEKQYLLVARRTRLSAGEGKDARKHNSLLSAPAWASPSAAKLLQRTVVRSANP
jgi:tetratricopeptide (TPR) repeat protein